MTYLRLTRALVRGLAFAAAVIIVAACSVSVTTTTSDPEPPVPKAPAPTIESIGGLEAILATTDLGPGPNRFSFLLLTPESLITVPEVSINAYPVAPDGSMATTPADSAAAGFHLWPYGTRGNYVAELDFPETGQWVVRAAVDDPDLGQLAVGIPVAIAPKTTTPFVGDTAPPTANKTSATVDSLSMLTTGSNPDPALYQLTVDQAVTNGLPTVLVFASPSLCSSPTCGPQVETVSSLAVEHAGAANFIHIEVYDNPHEIQGDLSRGRYSPPAVDWGLTNLHDYLNESWVFVLEPGGRIAARFEGYASADELMHALSSLLSA